LRPRVDELYALGKRYFQEEDLHNALRSWRRVLLIDPDDVRTREHIERAERMLSRLEEIQTSGS
jgi:cytochrome c-type biogenesis protein CcmH/NrfG